MTDVLNSADAVRFAFDNTYARDLEGFYVPWKATQVAQPTLVKLNYQLAEELGLDPAALDSEEGARIFAGNMTPTGALPLAQAYAGHQFGGFAPQLGDGRALLLGEVIDRNGRRRDIQLKGSGPTPFSRAGDGRAALGPVLREYLIGEAMQALGIPTTRALAAAITGEPVYRETALPGAVLTRVAASHIRVGTFQLFAARGEQDKVRRLADYVIARHFPELQDQATPYLGLLASVCEKQAKLIASWMHVGFIHGVMNTDNMAISGETIDYGPCAFLDEYDPRKKFSSIDRTGRYAFANQPRIAHWNVVRLAEALLSIVE
ncbi:MAG TPA: YdiU family protein, partial [Candidatus Binatus sp.]|nr:YdiU family protein [Candidatus Binatus sp.]